MAKLEKLGAAAKRLGVPWYHVPGREKYTRASLPPASPNPGASAVWPIPKTKARGRLFVSRFISGRGPTGGRCIGYVRSNGARHHAGVDVYCQHKDVVVACEDGQIVNFYYFYHGTYALIVDHGSFVINYGEVDGSSLIVAGLKSPTVRASQSGNMRDSKNKRTYKTSSKNQPEWVQRSLGTVGSKVKAGQAIGIVGRMNRSSMLHFEMYVAGTKANKGWEGFPTASPPSGMFDPTNYLLKLKAKEQRDPQKEVKLPEIHKTTS